MARVSHPAASSLRAGAGLLLAGVFLTGFSAGQPLSRAEYQAHFDAALSRYIDVGVAVEAKPYPTTEAGKIRRFSAAETLLREAIADLAVGSPPADAKSDNAAMVAEFRTFARLYQHVIADLGAGNDAAAQRASSTVARSRQNTIYGRAVKDLKAKGYKFHYLARTAQS